MATLYSWIGPTQDWKNILGRDRNGAPYAEADIYNSPICAMLNHAREIDKVVLLNDVMEVSVKELESTKDQVKAIDELRAIIEREFKVSVTVYDAPLNDPTNMQAVYENALHFMELYTVKNGEDVNTFYNVTSGTPVMQMVWCFIAKTQYAGRLLKSSPQQGVQEQDFPFDISPEYVPVKTKEKIVNAALDDKRKLFDEIAIKQFEDYGDIKFKSKQMRLLHQTAVQAGSMHNLPVCLIGEPGTEKEAIARLVHDESAFNTGPFVHFDCDSGDHMIDKRLKIFGEDELHRYSHSKERYIPITQKAATGSLYMQGIDKLEIELQVKLRDVLKKNEAQGSNDGLPFRLIVSTTTDLAESVKKGSFDQELYFLVSVSPIYIPSLSERGEDISNMANAMMHVVNEILRKNSTMKPKTLSDEALRYISDRSWPANVMELYSAIKRAAIVAQGEFITRADIAASVMAPPVERADGILDHSLGNGFDINQLVMDVRQHYARRALQQANNNNSVAAELLGLTNRQTLNYWMKKFEESK